MSIINFHTNLHSTDPSMYQNHGNGVVKLNAINCLKLPILFQIMISARDHRKSKRL